MRTHARTLLLACAPVALFVATAAAQTAATGPSPVTTTTLAPAGGLQVTVTGVTGLVQVRAAEGEPWKKCAVGVVLGEGAEFRTGPRSAVQFTIPPDQTITLDRLGTVKVIDAVRTGGKVKTDLGMKYGRTRYDIEAAGLEHDSTIRSPNSTLAIRGTKVSLTDQRPFPPEAISLTGRAQYTTAKREVSVGGRGTGKATASGDLSPADTALINSVIDPQSAFARSPQESALVATVLSRGSVFSFDRGTGIPIVRGGVPPTFPQIAQTFPTGLTVALEWYSDVNLDLGVGLTNPAGQTQNDFYLLPTPGLTNGPNGANIPFDHRGGPNGGFEIANIPAAPSGRYDTQIFYSRNGTVPGTTELSTLATVQAFLNGQPLNLLAPNLTLQKSVSLTVNPGGTGFVQFGVNVPILTLPGGIGGTGGPGGLGGLVGLDAARGGGVSPSVASASGQWREHFASELPGRSFANSYISRK